MMETDYCGSLSLSSFLLDKTSSLLYDWMKRSFVFFVKKVCLMKVLVGSQALVQHFRDFYRPV